MAIIEELDANEEDRSKEPKKNHQDPHPTTGRASICDLDDSCKAKILAVLPFQDLANVMLLARNYHNLVKSSWFTHLHAFVHVPSAYFLVHTTPQPRKIDVSSELGQTLHVCKTPPFNTSACRFIFGCRGVIGVRVLGNVLYLWNPWTGRFRTLGLIFHVGDFLLGGTLQDHVVVIQLTLKGLVQKYDLNTNSIERFEVNLPQDVVSVLDDVPGCFLDGLCLWMCYTNNQREGRGWNVLWLDIKSKTVGLYPRHSHQYGDVSFSLTQLRGKVCLIINGFVEEQHSYVTHFFTLDQEHWKLEGAYQQNEPLDPLGIISDNRLVAYNRRKALTQIIDIHTGESTDMVEGNRLCPQMICGAYPTLLLH